MPGIVVGIDGSEHSAQVLEWALKEAALQQEPLAVLTVHPVAGSKWTGDPVIYAEDQPQEERDRHAAEEAVAKALSRLGEARPASVTVEAVSGVPAQELIAASRDADLVVVGSRGGGGFAGLLLGSVSSQVVSHAACPVAVIRGSKVAMR
jgi:nucleotide-binding universal stress UspA family protein